MGSSRQRYHDYLLEVLRSPADREAYLNAAMDDGDPKALLKALRNVAEATGGMRRLATKAGLSRETLYRTLTPKGNPELDSLKRVLAAFGLTLRITSHRPTVSIRERWLFENKRAHGSLLRGLAEAKAGRLRSFGTFARYLGSKEVS